MTNIKIICAVLTTLFFSLTAVSCQDTKEQKAEQTEMAHDHGNPVSVSRTIEASTEKNPATTPLIDAYLQIKNGLVDGDKNAAASGGTALASLSRLLI